MTDQPTYDQLSALCAQMAATLQAITEMSGPMALKSAQAMAEIDLTAYRNLSPDPVWQRVPEGCAVVPTQLTSDMLSDLQRGEMQGFASIWDDLIESAQPAVNRARGEG